MKNLKYFSLLLFVIISTYFPAAELSNFDFKTKNNVFTAAVAKPIVYQTNEKIASKITYPTLHKTVEINGVDIFYREAGNKHKPTILLLHGYPTSSHMFRNLMEDLSDEYHLIAPDYPGFGNSEQPPMTDFDYTFDNMSNIVEGLLEKLEIKKYSIYLMDYGAPIGFRIAAKYPERVQGLIIQNGNAYDEGLRDFWIPIKKYWNDYTVENGKPLEGFHAPEGLKWQYTHGVRNAEVISPDNWEIDLRHINRPGNDKIQLAMFYDYRTNVPLYPSWQKYFRTHQPPTLIVWGKNDYIFPAEGAYPYKRDLKNVDFHLLETGHFALEEEGAKIAKLIRRFMKKEVN
jgi:pimeloyl-ACP methyl ester carboxylesterase